MISRKDLFTEATCDLGVLVMISSYKALTETENPNIENKLKLKQYNSMNGNNGNAFELN